MGRSVMQGLKATNCRCRTPTTEVGHNHAAPSCHSPQIESSKNRHQTLMGAKQNPLTCASMVMGDVRSGGRKVRSDGYLALDKLVAMCNAYEG